MFICILFLKVNKYFCILGYTDILLIPAGSTNIRVREIQPSNNYLGKMFFNIHTDTEIWYIIK